ncbi:MAG TPA: hypothetical protein VK921_05170 [Anditalea sp.]|nr:hypothetical protein [Anditalea sp.]
MLPSYKNSLASKNEDIQSLQSDITKLSESINEVKNDLEAFERIIHTRLDGEIRRLQELNILYKKNKQEKKQKRLEQKQRGKNYKAFTLPKPIDPRQVHHSNINAAEQKELRRLYKEAIVQVHPDKISHEGKTDHINRATDLTAQLNTIYKSGDLEELLNFYQYVILGNSLEDPEINMPEVDGDLRLAHLIKKKKALTKQLCDLKDSYTYGILTTYENPLTFIDELYIQLHERIKLMEKRTKKAK